MVLQSFVIPKGFHKLGLILTLDKAKYVQLLTRFSFDLSKPLGSLIQRVRRNSLNSIRILLSRSQVCYVHIKGRTRFIRILSQNGPLIFWHDTPFEPKSSTATVRILFPTAAKKSGRSKDREKLFTLYVRARHTEKVFSVDHAELMENYWYVAIINFNSKETASEYLKNYSKYKKAYNI